MQIQLKQTEIEAALKMFISNQGISLANKSVQMTFTSGRKDNGLSAELSIEDIGTPHAVKTEVPTQAEAPTTEETVKQAVNIFGNK